MPALYYHDRTSGTLKPLLLRGADVNAAIAAHEAVADPHTGYLRPVEVIPGGGVTVDTTTVPGSVIIGSVIGPSWVGNTWQFNSGANPGNQQLTASDGQMTIGVTWLRFDDQSLIGNVDMSAYLRGLTISSVIRLQQDDDPTLWLDVTVTGTPVDGGAGAWVEVPVTYLAESLPGWDQTWTTVRALFSPAAMPTVGLPTFIQDTQPTAGQIGTATKYMWWQTSGTALVTLWVEIGP